MKGTTMYWLILFCLLFGYIAGITTIRTMIKRQEKIPVPTPAKEITYNESDVNIDGLILTESGGDANAVGDAGKSLGLCQMSKAAWEDTQEWLGDQSFPYNTFWCDPTVNKIQADLYINEVIPKRYFKAWNIPDSIPARIAAYKYGPGRFREIWQSNGNRWVHNVSADVKRDIQKYFRYVKEHKT